MTSPSPATDANLDVDVLSAPSMPISISPADTSRTPPSTPALPVTVRVFTSSELLGQPWLSDLTRMINDGYSAAKPIEFSSDRLQSDWQLPEEIGDRGFTVVAFTEGKYDHHHPHIQRPPSRGQGEKIVGTASVKDWIDDGLWRPVPDPPQHQTEHIALTAAEPDDPAPDHFPCPGDLEITVVAIRPEMEYRKRGIAERVVRECEREILQRRSEKTSSVRVLLKVVKELNGPYWLKKGFAVVGQRLCPKGTWDLKTDFTLWAMAREVEG